MCGTTLRQVQKLVEEIKPCSSVGLHDPQLVDASTIQKSYYKETKWDLTTSNECSNDCEEHELYLLVLK